MSIIADTLKRLQAQSQQGSAESPEIPQTRPTFPKGEGTGHHQKPSQIKFWVITGGITLALGGLAIGAFWIGWHMDFGLAPHTQASINSGVSLPDPPPQEPMPVDLPSENPVAQELESVTIPQTAEMTDVAVSSALPQDEQKAPASEVSTNPETPEIAVADTKPENQNTPAIEDQTIDTEPEPDSTSIESEAEELSTVTTTLTPETSTAISPAFPAISDNMNDSESADSLTVPLEEEEIVQPDELIMTSLLTKESTKTGEPSPLPAHVEKKQLKTSVPPRQPLSPAQRLHNARQLIQIGQYQEASVLLRPMFHEPPVNWQPWFWMGTALLGKGDVEEADQFFLSGLARNDKVPQLWIQRALVAQQRGNYQLAIHELRQAELLKPDLPHIHLNMGYAYEQLGNGRLANQYYAKFLQVSEGNPEYFSIRKKLFSRLTQSTSSQNSTPSLSASSSGSKF